MLLLIKDILNREKKRYNLKIKKSLKFQIFKTVKTYKFQIKIVEISKEKIQKLRKIPKFKKKSLSFQKKLTFAEIFLTKPIIVNLLR